MAAADTNLCVVVNRLLELLRCSEVREKHGFLKDSEYQRLEETISTVAPLLLDAEKKSFQSYEVEKWLWDFGNELHHAENFLEAVKMISESDEAWKRKNSSKSKSIVKRVAKKVSAILFSTSLQLRASPSFPLPGYSIRGLLFLANQRYSFEVYCGRLGLVELSEKEIRVPAATGSSLVDGWGSIREKDKAAIMDILFDGDRAFEVLPIVGEPEIGKSFLERYVINNDRVQTHFHLVLWVHFSFPLGSRSLLEAILARLTKQKAEDWFDMEMMGQRVRDSLHDKRCLIVIVLVNLRLEDVAELNCIAQLLQSGAPGTRMLVITPSSLAKGVAGAWREYRLECLSEEESWDLFKKMAFPQGQGQDLASIEKQIAQSLKEHPHAIMAIGSMLHCEDYSEAERQLFCKNELTPLIEQCKYHYPSFDPFLRLSYDHLPSPLKHCLAYCSLFPNYYEIDVQSLTKLWMAQGFVAPPLETTSIGYTSDEDLEDISYEYFLNLHRRSLFHDAKFDARGRVTKCRMHHWVHNLATLVSQESCCLLFTNTEYTIHRSRCPFHVSLVDLTVNDEYLISKWPSQQDLSALRSLLFLTQREGRPDYRISDWDEIFYNCSFLRALDMHACGIKTVPYSIGKLKHLKYLDLSQNEDITELPDSITNLLNLQTLRLSLCFRLKRLPRDIGNLVNLRHLEYDGCYGMTSLPQGFGQLTNLRTLSQVVLSEDASKAADELNELGQLSNLREVRIKNLKHRMGEQILKCLKNMQKVRSLSLEWESREPDSDHKALQLEAILSSHLEEFTLNGFRAISGFSFLPSSPTNLVRLSLKRLVKCKILPPLDQCSKLKVLVLDEMTDLECISGKFSTPICPSLQELWLTELPKLKSWWTDGLQITKFPSFSCLSRLVIEDCPNLDSLPLFPTLEEGLVLDSTSWELFRNTMNQKATADEHKPSSSTSTPVNHSPPLSKLKNMCIVAIEKFDNSEAEEISWATLKSLQMLKFDFLPEITALPEGLQQVTSLRELHIWRCGIKEIPEWIDKLELLERLVIRECPNMKRLHADISLKKLLTLEIENCPTLQRRCEEETGADWDKIAHIPKKLFGRISAK